MPIGRLRRPVPYVEDVMGSFENENQARIAARRRAAKRRQAARKRRAALRTTCVILVLLLAALIGGIWLLSNQNPLLPEVTVEAGSELNVEMFLSDPDKLSGKDISFVTDVSGIDKNTQADHEIELSVNGKTYSTVLHVKDRIAPTGKAVETVTEVNVMPDPVKLVTDIRDVGEVTVSYRNDPDVSKGGETYADVQLTDAAGNTALIRVKLTVIDDKVPPVIEGAADMEYYVGDPISYKSGITVTDDQTANPKLTVDNTQVNIKKAGTYPVTYIAEDNAGNKTSVTVYLTLVDKPEGYVEPDVVYAMAEKILDEITTEDMSDMEVAFAIYRWVSTHIAYTGHSDKSSWTRGAYDAFTNRAGDCFNYFAAAKAMYNVAGIDNVDVQKVVTENTSRSSHYWSLINLGDGWYHVDCTPRNNPGFFFMNTDAELLAYSVKNKNCHNFDKDAYPERATESVQDKVDYANGIIKD